jgi:hypothetical protein
MVHPTVFLIDFYTREDADPANVIGFKLSFDASNRANAVPCFRRSIAHLGRA